MQELIDTLMTPVMQVALIIAIAELVKGLGINKKYIPIVDVAVGILLAFLVYYTYFNRSVIETIVLGLAQGLSACGLFSGIKNLTQGDKKNG